MGIERERKIGGKGDEQVLAVGDWDHCLYRPRMMTTSLIDRKQRPHLFPSELKFSKLHKNKEMFYGETELSSYLILKANE